jgi:protein phosphatase slingshot
VRHILNVTREIDNFFPGMFNYLNVRVYDDEKTDLLKHWDDTFKYITKAKKEGSKVLVHCKMGVSRSASVVIAYAMKAYNWDFSQALRHVKNKRNCIKPNNSFLLQLETYQGILDAMKNKEKLQRSKSDTNLKSPTMAAKERTKEEKTDREDGDSCDLAEQSGLELKKSGQRPKSWSPNVEITEDVLPTGNDANLLIDNRGGPFQRYYVLLQLLRACAKVRHVCLFFS